MKIYTIGFTGKRASTFFQLLKAESIEQLVDVRLNNTSQLSGFSKRDDLEYFLKEICNVEYKHETLLAPTQEMLDAFKKAKGEWTDYQSQFLSLMATRQIENNIPRELFRQRTVLLCSESSPEHCHRKMVVDYLCSNWGDVQSQHL